MLMIYFVSNEDFARQTLQRLAEPNTTDRTQDNSTRVPVGVVKGLRQSTVNQLHFAFALELAKNSILESMKYAFVISH